MTINGERPELIEVIPRNWKVVAALALPRLFMIKPLTLPCKAVEISEPLTPTIKSFAETLVTALVTCFFSIVP